MAVTGVTLAVEHHEPPVYTHRAVPLPPRPLHIPLRFGRFRRVIRRVPFPRSDGCLPAVAIPVASAFPLSGGLTQRRHNPVRRQASCDGRISVTLASCGCPAAT